MAVQFRLSKPAAADTERTFACTVPAWGEGGKMPDEATFTTNLQGTRQNGTRAPSMSLPVFVCCRARLPTHPPTQCAAP